MSARWLFITPHLAALNALGDFNFALAGEQGNRAHFAQIHAHGVIGLFQHAGREIQLHVLRLFIAFGVFTGPLTAAFTREHLDALGVDRGHQVVQFVGRRDVSGEKVVDLTVGEVALLLAGVNHSVYIFFVLIKLFSHSGAPRAGAACERRGRRSPRCRQAPKQLDERRRLRV